MRKRHIGISIDGVALTHCTPVMLLERLNVGMIGKLLDGHLLTDLFPRILNSPGKAKPPINSFVVNQSFFAGGYYIWGKEI